MGNRLPRAARFLRPPRPYSVAPLVPPSAMEVTKNNFFDVLPKVAKAIQTADFVAIDGEFTGLNADNNSIRSVELDSLICCGDP